MTERRRPHRRGRRPTRRDRQTDQPGEPNPYRDAVADMPDGSQDLDIDISPPPTAEHGSDRGSDGSAEADAPAARDRSAAVESEGSEGTSDASRPHRSPDDIAPQAPVAPTPRFDDRPHRERDEFHGRNGRRHRRNRRGRRGPEQQTPPTPIIADSETAGWFDTSRDGGFIRRASNSYLAESGDAFVPPHVVRQYSLRRGDVLVATTGRDHRQRIVVVEITSINDQDPATLGKRPDFQSLTATYPDRRLTMETGRPARGGPELTRRCIDLMAPIGYGQRALIVAPARAGKTMLLHALTEGIALNHPKAVLLILLVDERPEEVSEAISWGVGEVIASSFDQPAHRHVEVCEMVLEHARRLVELGRDVVIVLDSLTRMARAHNTAERGSGRTMSGGLDTTAMAKPKAFFGSARAVAERDGGGSLTIISTALVETGSRMDDVIFEEFKGTGNCEIKLDRSLSEKRIFPAFDIAASGTRREEKLYKPDQIDAIYTLRRGLQQMPPQAAMEWMIKRIANTPNNDALLTGL
ncbi:MAG: Transcription termination factor Rho [Gemmatimonadaceae bacterium]|nr:Transcription termination factor Rho [Gemmatimonadaceae bacterium]